MPNSFALALLPVGLTSAGAVLVGKDPSNTGADDAVGQICIALAPILPELLTNSEGNSNAVLKAMRAIEQVAHAYREQMNDPQLANAAARTKTVGQQDG